MLLRPRVASWIGSCREGCVTQHQSGPEGLSVGAHEKKKSSGRRRRREPVAQHQSGPEGLSVGDVRALEKKIFQQCLRLFVRLIFTVASHLADQVNDVLVGSGDLAVLHVILGCAAGKKDKRTASPMAQLLFAVLHNSPISVDGGGWLYIAGGVSPAQIALLPPGAVSEVTRISDSGVAEPWMRIHLAQLLPDRCTEGPLAYCVAALFCAVVVRLIDSEDWDTEPVTPVRDSADRWCCLLEHAQSLWTCRNQPYADTAAAALLELIRVSVVRFATDTYSILVLPVAVHVHAMFHEKDSKTHRDSTIAWANSTLADTVSVATYAEWEGHLYYPVTPEKPSPRDRPESRVRAGLKDGDGFHERYALVVSRGKSAAADGATIALTRVRSGFIALADQLCIPQTPVCSDPEAICHKKGWRLVLPPVQNSPPSSSSLSPAPVEGVPEMAAAAGAKRKSDQVLEASPADVHHIATEEAPLPENAPISDEGAAGEAISSSPASKRQVYDEDDPDAPMIAQRREQLYWAWGDPESGDTPVTFSNGETM